MSPLAALVNNPISLILLAACFGVCGQLSLKVGMNQVGQLGAEVLEQPLQVALRVVSTPLVISGLAMYVFGAMLWMMVLSRSALSFAYPILAIGYAITPMLAWLLLGENMNAVRWLGIAVICAGVFVVSRS
jgi:multidrug transporter EmrE-like cation transporter